MVISKNEIKLLFIIIKKKIIYNNNKVILKSLLIIILINIFIINKLYVFSLFFRIFKKILSKKISQKEYFTSISFVNIWKMMYLTG